MKKLIKTISLMIALLLVVNLLFTLASCDASDLDESEAEEPTTEIKTDPPSENEKGKLTEEMRNEIKRAYFEKTYIEKSKEFYNSPDQITLICYGVFDNAYCVILTRPGVEYMTVITEETVGEYTFMFSSSNTMKVYCEGDFYGLTKAYENGILDDAEIEELYNYYTEIKWGKIEQDDDPTMELKIERKIQYLFLENTYGEAYKEYGYMPMDVPIECYGIFDDAYCVILWDKTGGRMGTVTEVTVAGYKFVYGTPDVIQVYFNEALYDLTTAYENGILNESEIAELYANYNEKHLKNKVPSALAEEIKQEIQIARLIEAHGEDYAEKGQTLSDVYIECYGIFDSAYCVLLRTANITVLPVGKTLTVCGYDFEFGLAQEVMRVYYNGELCDLDEAYENGILDDDEVAELYDYYQKSNWYK